MGEMSGGTNPTVDAAMDSAAINKVDGVATDVEGVTAAAEKNGMPVFDVSKDEFYQNMNYGRRRLRFKTDTPAQKYLSGTKYKRSFFIREPDGYTRKVK